MSKTAHFTKDWTGERHGGKLVNAIVQARAWAVWMDGQEVRPVDMAIWRAILAGREGYIVCAPGMERFLRKLIFRRLYTPSRDLAQMRRVQAQCPLSRMHRVVLFVHPITGGRAVYSEPVE